VPVAAPEFRANWSKLALKSVRRLAAPERDRVLDAIGEPTLAQIRAASALAWLPAEAHHRVALAVERELGSDGARAFFRDLMLVSFDRPLIRPLVEGGLRLFGATPKAVLRLTPQAWSLVARRCGTIAVEDGATPGGARLLVDGIPPALSTTALVAIVTGNCWAVLSRLRLDGDVVADLTSLRRGSFRVEVTPQRAR